MYNARLIRKIIRYFLLNSNIDKIGLCMRRIGVYFYHTIFYIDQKHFNAIKNVLDIKLSAVSYLITLSRSIISLKRYLIIIISILRYNQVISITFNTRL